jgi:hypothetical protein
MPEESQLKVFATMYFDRVDQMSIPSGPANSPCQSDISLVYCLSDTSAAASITSPRPQSLSPADGKIAQFLCNLSPLDATLLSHLLCVANKELAQYLSLLDATLTKTQGVGGIPVAAPVLRP